MRFGAPAVGLTIPGERTRRSAEFA